MSLIVTPEQARLIVQGKKRAARKPANGKPCRYQVGYDYAVQPGRGKKQLARVTIVDVERQQLGAFTYEDALDEGFRNRADFARYWMALHDKAYEVNGASGEQILEVWLERHGETQVWAITFERKRALEVVVQPRPLYLHRNPVWGLTSDPSRKAAGEPEVLDGRERTGSVSRALRKAELEHQARLRQAHALVERARTALAEAVAADVDLAELEQHVAELEHRLRAA